MESKCNFQITTEHGGAVYRFASEANRDRFVADPERYLPQYGGYCAYGVAVNDKFTADPTVWKIVDGKLYLTHSPAVFAMWSRDIAGNLARESTRSIR